MLKYLILLLASVHYCYSADNSETNGKVIVELENFISDEGFSRIQLFNTDSKSYFPKQSNKAYTQKVVRISGRRVTVDFDNLPFGSYAITAHHDKNANEKMDMNFFNLPAEGWGLSNNIIPVFSLPDFEECSFKVFDKSTKIKIKMRN
jgi:uncharacterized protein (DUF2141 family)